MAELTKACKVCGKDFTSKAHNARHCSTACGYQARKERERNGQTATKTFAECDVCGKEFQQYRPTQKRCSAKCRQVSNRERLTAWRHENPELMRSYRTKWEEANPERVKAKDQAWARNNRDLINARRRASYAENPDPYREMARRWREENPHEARQTWKNYHDRNRDKRNAESKKWRQDNLEYAREYDRAYNIEHREHYRLWALNDRRKDPEKYYIRAHRRRARMAEAFVEDVQLSVLLQQYNNKCGICGITIPTGITDPNHPLYPNTDHINPISNGGEHSYANTQPTHHSCNTQKQAKVDGWKHITPILEGRDDEHTAAYLAERAAAQATEGSDDQTQNQSPCL